MFKYFADVLMLIDAELIVFILKFQGEVSLLLMVFSYFFSGPTGPLKLEVKLRSFGPDPAETYGGRRRGDCQS